MSKVWLCNFVDVTQKTKRTTSPRLSQWADITHIISWAKNMCTICPARLQSIAHQGIYLTKISWILVYLLFIMRVHATKVGNVVATLYVNLVYERGTAYWPCWILVCLVLKKMAHQRIFREWIPLEASSLCVQLPAVLETRAKCQWRVGLAQKTFLMSV